ncbi:flagellin [Nocardioides sp. MAH-18]|uniref:Flagellin n=1 Tax=Nocardioides agri TaxID=2682843 RepID=A0A6L6XTX4_9ACTN|nr:MULTISPECIES: flagellin [unclassified Nocardioides]MBA2955789.1 flagellin [Nocardioides sp. CGMCC 1.13656]MVQ50639.1 flagellin [Nocardioides sp. MAH-18]
MALRINQNIDALNSYRNLSVTQGNLSKSLEKLSSGFRINRAGDDAAGLAISEGLRAQVGGLKVGARNAQDGISVVQTAEGALTEVHSMLQRMNDLAVQYKSGTVTGNTDAEGALAAEFQALSDEVGRIEDNTKFNGVALFAGTDVDFQVGYATSDKITVDGAASLKSFKGGVAGLDITAATASDDVQAQINAVSTQRASLGAFQNRFEHTINSVNTAIENLSASESRIRDTDMAQEMMSFTRSQILSQAGTAMLAQANQAPQGVLSLLR